MNYPWQHIVTPEFEEKHGHYAQFAAFERWLNGIGDGLIVPTILAGDNDGPANLAHLCYAIQKHCNKLQPVGPGVCE